MKLIAAIVGTVLVIGLSSATAQPFAARTADPVGQQYVFSTNSTGGSGSDVFFDIPTIPNGYYTVSWAANFYPQGTTSAPVEWSCFLLVDNDVSGGQSTTTDTGMYYAGVSGSTNIHVGAGTSLQMVCGISTNAAWDWGTYPLQVTFVKMAGRTAGKLGSPVTEQPRLTNRSLSGPTGNKRSFARPQYP